MKVRLVLINFLLVSSALGYENFCSRSPRYERVAKSKCIGKELPSDRIRNMKENSHEIVCGGNVDHYVRRPQKLDLNEWETLLKIDKQEAQDFAWKSLPPIKWSGMTTFKTIETWKWESCDLITDGSICGQDRVVSYETVNTTDHNGNPKTETREVVNYVPRTCYADVTHTEYDYCSTEKMEYSAEYVRPNKNEWKPGAPGFYDQLPVKYDLLPGESEVVQTFSTESNYTQTLRPSVKIPDAWNIYQIDISGNSFECEQLSAKGLEPYNFSFKINTVRRDVGKQSPNAFKLPVDFDGNKMDVIQWASDVDKKGNHHDMAYPKGVQLIDTSAAMVNMIAEQSRENTDYAKAKHEAGLLSNSDGVEITDEGSKGFFKNTEVKVRIVDVNNYWFDNHFGEVYTDDVKATKASLNAISENQEVARSDLWFLDLDGEEIGKNNIYGNWNLKPNKDDYVIEVSMYQKGVPFYNQSCENDPNPPRWACNSFVRMLGMGRQESDYYSESLTIPLQTGSYDKRGFFKKVVNFFGYR